MNLIGGEWTRSRSAQTFDSGNPADRQDVVGQFQASVAEDGQAAVDAAAQAFARWRAKSVSARAQPIMQAAAWLESHVEMLALELTREQGKSLAQSRDEVLRSAEVMRYYAIEAQSLTGETFPSGDPGMSVYTLREPLGVVTIITPWNFPLSIPVRKIIPALITGNTVVFKPSSETPLVGYRLTQALVESGLPPGVLNFITGAAASIGPAITEPATVRAISFTGSTAAGEQIHRAVGLTTRTQMELGGKNPVIVMEDADLDQAVDITVKGAFALAGQACTGTSRVLVVASVREAFTEKLLARVRALKVGPGTQPGMDLGPLASQKQLDTVLRYVEIGKKEATHLLGGERLTGAGFDEGFYVSPAVFTDVTADMRICREEIFGPVIALVSVSDYGSAIACANDTDYGLSAAIVTCNPRYMHDFERDIEAGTVKINRTTTGNVINAPFGGLKRSSTSTFRESGRVGLEFYTQIKTVYRGL